MKSLLIAIILVAWFVAALAMLKMAYATITDPEKRGLWSVVDGTMVTANYNRDAFRVFATCVGIAIAAVFVLILIDR